MVYFNIFIIYFYAFIICFNVFHCIWMYLNVFINIVIGILPSHSHCNVFTMYTHLYIFISLYTMTSFPTCYTITLSFFHPFQLLYNLWKNYISILTSCQYITPHSMFHIPHSISSLVVRSIVVPKSIYTIINWMLISIIFNFNKYLSYSLKMCTTSN
jgi:hypothetical protein